MHFGKQLIAKRHEPWAAYYLDYQALKELLEVPMLTAKSSSPTIRGGSHHFVVTPFFIELLHAQVDRVVHFFLQQQGVLSTTLVQELQPRLDGLLKQIQYDKGSTDLLIPDYLPDDMVALQAAYYQEARTLLRLIQFVDLNVTGLRKILKKHDKLTGGHLSHEYFRHVHHHDTDGSTTTTHANGLVTTSTTQQLQEKQRYIVLRPLLQDGGLEALFATLRYDLFRLEECSQRLPPTRVPATTRVTLDRWNTWTNGEEPEANGRQATHYGTMTDGGGLSRSERGGIVPTASLMPAFAKPVPPTSGSTTTSFMPPHDVSIVLLQIQAARGKLRQSSDFVRMLAASAALLPSHDDDDDEASAKFAVPTNAKRRLSNLLNFCSTFLHMTDYYIIAPTSGMYAERLGEAAALAGLIIGLNSCSALVSTVLYSWWTTYFSYKSALIFASTCQMTGCLVYASALPCQSLTMVIVGRLIGGFGSARSINRRYIADTFPVATRTVASAGFVTAGALGTSTGPALAALLYFVVPIDGDNMYWQIENAPGWTMALLWAIYIICLFVHFTEPDRPHKPGFGRKVVPKHVQKVDEEQSSLLAIKDKNGSAESRAADSSSITDPPLWKIVSVNTTFFVYFTLKFILESLLSSTAILTDYYFGWSGKTSGWYLSILGLLVLPANWLIAVASQRHDDRDLILTTLAFIVLGCLVILNVGSTYSVAHFLLGSIIIFCATNCLEGPNMSLLSKTIPLRYSRGLFNVGLLATESGTLGRAVGDIILTLCGSTGMGHILNRAFGMMAGLSTVTIAICFAVYDQLEPQEKDD